MEKLSVIDCTFRDGGYYNDWDFDRDLVKDYLAAISQTGVSNVELGLRSFPKKGFFGPFAYTTDRFLASIDLADEVCFGVMVDAKTVIESGRPAREAVRHLFSSANDSRIGMVRIAAHFAELEHTPHIVEAFKELGYQVGLNLMQASLRSKEELSQTVASIQEWGLVDVLYFADSLGNMDRSDIVETIDIFKAAWEGEIGLHAHNNMGQANENTLTAVEHGCTWVDATVLGMGRGAGNCQTEILLTELNRKFGCSYNPEPVYALVLEHFRPLQSKLGWGPNFLYHYSAINEIHPTYAQELLADTKYDADQKLATLRRLAAGNSTSFVAEALHLSQDEPEAHLDGSWDANAWCEGRDVLILGGGESLAQYSRALSDFARSGDIAVLSLNFHDEIEQELIWAYVTCSEERLRFEVNLYKSLTAPKLIVPAKLMGDSLLGEISIDKKVLDYDLLQGDELIIEGNGCVLPVTLSLPYALAVAISGGARTIYLAGFDGYSGGDSQKNVPLSDVVTKLAADYEGQIVSLTRTILPVEQSSIFAF